MISKETLSLEWLQKISKQNRNTDKILIEKTIRALFLLEGLSETKLSYIFRGGTAVMLLLKSNKRFSIDIDIIISKKIDLNSFFNKIC